MTRRRICVVSGGRADYGLLYWPMKEIAASAAFELQLVLTGMHLAPEFGATASLAERDGFAVAARVEMLLASDTPVGVAKSIGLGVIGFADAFERLKPDLLMVLGDRFEILAAAEAALVARLPVAHLCGGDVTEGAFDEAIRHAITKMAHLHFATNDAASRRLRQLGEDPQRIFTVGSPGIDYIHRLEKMTREELARDTGLDLGGRVLLVTFHPPTLGSAPALAELEELLAALAALGPETTLAFTLPNADTAGRALAARLERFRRRASQGAALRGPGLAALSEPVAPCRCDHRQLVERTARGAVAGHARGRYRRAPAGQAQGGVGDLLPGRAPGDLGGHRRGAEAPEKAGGQSLWRGRCRAAHRRDPGRGRRFPRADAKALLRPAGALT
jgi:UDP-hydrolysing UDP-N-acetyl-D-glucosamine 2-epimerase